MKPHIAAAALLAWLGAHALAPAAAPPGPMDAAPIERQAAELLPDTAATAWLDAALAILSRDEPRPTVNARRLYYLTVAMHDAWAAFDPQAPQLVADVRASAADPQAARDAAVGAAAHAVLRQQARWSRDSALSAVLVEAAAERLGVTRAEPAAGSPAWVGERVAAACLDLAAHDGSRESVNYLHPSGRRRDRQSLDPVGVAGAEPAAEHWQPLLAAGRTQFSLTPHWGTVLGFCPPEVLASAVEALPGPPTLGDPARRDELRAAVLELIVMNSLLDPGDAGAAPWPEAGDIATADAARVLVEYWEAGRGTPTPPGMWNSIARQVTRSPRCPRRIGGVGEPVDRLEWDVKLLVSLNAALHDSAVAAWAAKSRFDSARPVTLIRAMAARGQCTDPSLPSFDEWGLPLVPGLVELVTPQSAAPGGRHEHLSDSVGMIAVRGWLGPGRRWTRGEGGVGWVRAARDWRPYQHRDTPTPPFPGYVSGHSAFSHAAAEVLERFTGGTAFPGGPLMAVVPTGSGLRFEAGPSEPVSLSWATFDEAARAAGLSRRWGGIHLDCDDNDGRVLGRRVGAATYELMQQRLAQRQLSR